MSAALHGVDHSGRWRMRPIAQQPARERQWTGSLPLRLIFTAALVLAAASSLVIALALAFGASRPAPDFAPLLGETPCAAPCWHGITPGDTTPARAVALLEQDPSVDAIVTNVDSASWWWNGSQAPVFRHQAQPFDGRMLFDSDDAGGPVNGLALMTTLTVGDLYLKLGPPRSQTLHLAEPPSPPFVIYEARYNGVSLFATLACPLSPAALWNAPAGLIYGKADLALGGVRLSTSGTDWPLRRFAGVCSPGP